MRREWQIATGLSIAAHLPLFFLGNDAVDSRRLATDAGQGPRGKLAVIAITPDQAAAMLARRGPARVPMLVEAGGLGLPTMVEPVPLDAPRPDGPNGAGLGAGPTLLDLGPGRRGDALRQPTPGTGALGSPDALPSAPSAESGSPADPSVAVGDETVDETEGPDAAAASGELSGSDGQHADDAAAADGDDAIGLDAATADELLLFRAIPDYPVALARRKIGGQSQFEFTVDDRGRVGSVRLLRGTGNGTLDRNAERALRRWRFDAGRVAARGWLGRRWRVEITFGDEDR